MLRAAECAFYRTSGDPDSVLRLVSAASYSSIQSADDAVTYMNLTGFGSPITFNIVNNDINAWESSCDYLIEKQLEGAGGSTSTTSVVTETVRLVFDHSTNSVSDTCASALDVYFINGICGSIDSIALSAAALKHYIAKLPDADNINVIAFENPSNGLWCSIDLLEAIQQKIEEHGGWPTTFTILDVVKFSLSSPLAANGYPKELLSPLYEFTWINEALEKFAENIASYLSGVTPVSSTTASLSAKVTDSLFHGKSVILLGHSQGNLYVNAAYQTLSSDNMKYVQPLAVATPALYVGKPSKISPYVTRNDDLVINVVRRIAGALPGNTLPSVSDGILNHGFLKSYMGDFITRNAIMGDLQSLLSTATYPVTIGLSGPITVTLTWGPQPDIDLHVFEPDGTHVYYRDKRGVAGYLDVDDTSSFGPENYFVAFNTLKLGSYRIGINYYYGRGPDVAHISIRTCTSIRDYEQAVSVSCSSACDNNPVMIAEISVTKDQSNALMFEINSLL